MTQEKEIRGGETPLSLIASDMRIDGNLSCPGSLHVEGRVEGDIQCKDVVVGENAVVSGNISGETVRISGTVEGHLKADSVTLARTARVRGDIVHKSLTIEQGAHFEGMCRRLDGKPGLIAAEIKPGMLFGAGEKLAMS
ncbi:MAG TPA: polymer-forming cytoskeletal protein [Dongiaceae bacterium]|nr:polymer-forming cytoskeletal protein [Dongiaceae bacterium]